MLKVSSIPWQKPTTPKAESAETDFANGPFAREVHDDGGSRNPVQTTFWQSRLNHSIEPGEVVLSKAHSGAFKEGVQLLTLPTRGSINVLDAQMPELIEHGPDRRVLPEFPECLGTPLSFGWRQGVLHCVISFLTNNRTKEPSLQQHHPRLGHG